MSATAIILISSVLVLVASNILWGVFLRIGLRWARVPNVSWRKIIYTVVLVFLLLQLLQFGSQIVLGYDPRKTTIAGLFSLIASVLVPCLTIMRFFSIGFPRALFAWAFTLFASLLTAYVFMPYVLRPYVWEQRPQTNNTMAPTLLSRHWKGKCAVCGNNAYCSPVFRAPANVQVNMICEGNFHVTQPKSHTTGSADQVMVAKFIKPKRWDIVMYQNPRDPSVMQFGRLVGFPGEEITIRNGKVFAGKKPLKLPNELKGLRYTTDLETGSDTTVWGSPEHPATLNKDEYFVLGDFSQQALDSRFWQLGAKGHHPYAVPETNIQGVVVCIYAPWERWQVLK